MFPITGIKPLNPGSLIGPKLREQEGTNVALLGGLISIEKNILIHYPLLKGEGGPLPDQKNPKEEVEAGGQREGKRRRN
jgi:hypothetical protein